MMNIDLTFHNVEWGTLMGLYFNTFGERLSTVSANLTPDIYEQPANILDFTASQKVFTYFTINFSVKNILNEEYSEVYRYKGNDFIYQSYNLGRKVSLGLTYSM
jgi:outer membrane receptor protein involved in Fe transport